MSCNAMSCNAMRKMDHSHDAEDHCTVEGGVPLDLLSRLRQLCLGVGAQTGVPCRLCVKPEHARFEAAAAEVLFQALREPRPSLSADGCPRAGYRGGRASGWAIAGPS